MTDQADYPRATHEWISYLAAELAPLRVSNKVLPDQAFVRIRRIGGTRLNLVLDDPTMTVECYDVDDDQAEQLATRVRTTVLRAQGGRISSTAVCKRISEYSGPYEDPDENHGSSRFSWTFTAAMRATNGGQNV